MNVSLVFPPQWIPDHPYLSVPSLAAYLRERRGDEVHSFDLNVECYADMLTPGYVQACHRRAVERLGRLERASRCSPQEAEQFRMSVFFLEHADRAIGTLEWALETFHDPERFYRYRDHKQAQDILRFALGLVSIAHYPTGVGLTTLRFGYSEQSSEQILEAVANPEQNPYLELFRDRHVPRILAWEPELVGISIVCSSQLIPGLTLARELVRARRSDGSGPHVCLGGPLLTMMAEEIRSAPRLWGLFDSLVLYEGEKPLAALAGALETGSSLDGVPNLIYRKEGEIRATDLCQPEGMDGLPTPDFEGFPLEKYLSPQPLLPILASRGCYWRRCSFCQHSFGYQNTYRVRPVDRIVDDLETLIGRHGSRRFIFTDEAMAPSMARKLSTEIAKRELEVYWGTDVRAEKQFTPDLCHALYKAGCREVFIGLESGSDRVLDLMNKGITRRQARDVFRAMGEAGIWTHAFIVLGFPGETLEEAESTASFVLAHPEWVRSTAFLDSFVLARHCTVYRRPADFGVAIEPPGTDRDLALYFQYEEAGGRSEGEKKAFADRFWDRLNARYPDFHLWYHIFRGNLFHYLCHWGTGDLSEIPELRDGQPSRALPDVLAEHFSSSIWCQRSRSRTVVFREPRAVSALPLPGREGSFIIPELPSLSQQTGGLDDRPL